MTYDLIIVAASQNQRLIDMTQNAIDSCLRYYDKVNVIVVETFRETNYIGAKIIMYTGQFNYNRALNLGLKEAKGDIQILANNDIEFTSGWGNIGLYMKSNDFLSACALSNDPRQAGYRRGNYYYEGYTIGHHLAGWCIFAQKELFDIIGDLDETHQFWFSDNVYADQLIRKGVKHALICNILVLHKGNQTLNAQPKQIINLYTNAKGKRLHADYPKDLQT